VAPHFVIYRLLTKMIVQIYEFKNNRAPDKVRISSIMTISLPNPMFDHLLEPSHRDDSNKWSNIGFCEEMSEEELIEVNVTHLVWCSDTRNTLNLSELVIQVWA